MEDRHKEYKQYNSRKEWMQAEFNFSNEEVEGLDKFLSGRESGLVSEFLRSIMETECLNNRQKVVISFMMGRFVQETIEGQMRSIEKSMANSSYQSSEFNDQFGGQFGGQYMMKYTMYIHLSIMTDDIEKYYMTDKKDDDSGNKKL